MTECNSYNNRVQFNRKYMLKLIIPYGQMTANVTAFEVAEVIVGCSIFHYATEVVHVVIKEIKLFLK